MKETGVNGEERMEGVKKVEEREGEERAEKGEERAEK